MSFNPRPSRKRGATGRIMRAKSKSKCFNPRPSRKRGATNIGQCLVRRADVSILAPLARGALPGINSIPITISQFQSSPLSQEGRYRRQQLPGLRRLVSILAPLARGALRGKKSRGMHDDQFQSSPLSQEGRYLLAAAATPPTEDRFNPRPSRKRGAT